MTTICPPNTVNTQLNLPNPLVYDLSKYGIPFPINTSLPINQTVKIPNIPFIGTATETLNGNINIRINGAVVQIPSPILMCIGQNIAFIIIKPIISISQLTVSNLSINGSLSISGPITLTLNGITLNITVTQNITNFTNWQQTKGKQSGSLTLNSVDSFNVDQVNVSFGNNAPNQVISNLINSLLKSHWSQIMPFIDTAVSNALQNQQILNLIDTVISPQIYDVYSQIGSHSFDKTERISFTPITHFSRIGSSILTVQNALRPFQSRQNRLITSPSSSTSSTSQCQITLDIPQINIPSVSFGIPDQSSRSCTNLVIAHPCGEAEITNMNVSVTNLTIDPFTICNTIGSSFNTTTVLRIGNFTFSGHAHVFTYNGSPGHEQINWFNDNIGASESASTQVTVTFNLTQSSSNKYVITITSIHLNDPNLFNQILSTIKINIGGVPHLLDSLIDHVLFFIDTFIGSLSPTIISKINDHLRSLHINIPVNA